MLASWLHLLALRAGAARDAAAARRRDGFGSGRVALPFAAAKPF